MSLEYLFSPTKQFTYPSGKLLDGGKIYVYFKDTENLATLYSPEDTFVSNPILLDANGRASVRADVAYQYRLEIYTNKDVLLYTCEAFCEGDGSGGFSFVIHDETLSGNGTAANPLGVVNIPLAVDETMTAYTAMVEEKESLVLGVNGDWFTDTFGSALNNKVDLSSFSSCCVAVKGGLDNKLDISSFDLSNYYNKQETNNLLDQRVDRNEFTQTINWIDQTKQDKLEFDYNENSAISAINGSALAGQGDGACPWISGGKEIADVQVLTSNMNFQVLSSFTLSGDHNHFISVKGGIYRFPNEWELASGIAITNYFLPQSSFSSYSSTVTSEFSTLYGQDSYLSGRIDNLSGVLKSTSSTVNSNSGNWGKSYTACTANSGNWNSVYNTVHGNSGIWNNKLDTSAFTAYTAQADESYLLMPGTGIAISSDSAQATTTIWFTGDAGDTQVNNVVRTNSASWNGKLDASALSAGEGITITSSNGKQVITNNISAGDNISLVYDSVTNKIRIDCEVTGGGDLTNYYKKTETSSKLELSSEFNNIYTKTETSSKQEISAALQYVSSNAGHTYTGVAPITVNNVNNQISISGESLSAGPGIDMFSSGGYVVISANGSNCYCLVLNPSTTSVNLENYSAYDKLTILHGKEYATTYEIHWDGKTKEIPSGLYIEMGKVKDMNDLDKWTFLNSGWANNGWWDYD